MVELNSIVVVILVEALLALFLLIFIWLLLSKKKVARDQQASHDFIDKLQNNEKNKEKKLIEIFSTHIHLEEMLEKELLAEMMSSERHLYQQIIQLFLKKDIDVLIAIGQYVDDFSQPYHKLLAYSSEKGLVNTAPLEEQKQINQHLIQENERLGEQLVIAIKALDEISDEYTRVFSGTQTELELENSSKKMFTIFQQAEQKTKANTNYL